MRNKKTLIKIIAIVLVCSALSFFAGYFVSVGTLVSWKNVMARPLTSWFKQQHAVFFDEDEVDIKNIEAFNRVKDVLRTRYYKPVDVNALFVEAIKGLAEGVEDPYTVYYDPDEMKRFMEESSGNYEGIGVLVSMDENYLLTVAEVFPESPAKEAGIQKGDKIVRVDQEDVTDIKDPDLIVKKIKGAPGTIVTITVFREEVRDYIDFDVTRQTINVSYISSKVLDDQIGYIRIKQFDNDISQDFQNHLNSLLAQEIKGLVIDLRDNPGGDYREVVKICDMLLPNGLIVYVEDRYGNRREEFSDSNHIDIPMSVLINGYSASASEIMSAALKDYGKGILVGTKTFGKGLVQQIDLRFTNGGGLKYTIARYFTPSGKHIHDVGVEPDIEVVLDEEFKSTSIDDIPHDKDNQLQVAISEIKKRYANP
jgi:carboxyl-terminal processing protease